MSSARKSHLYGRGVAPVALCAAALAIWLSAIGAGQTVDLHFHHLHLASGLDFYARLFDPAVTRKTTIAGYDALKSGSMLLLFGAPRGRASVAQQPSAIWHFGWGSVSLGETYLRHAAREVEWDPPLAAERLHLHVLSASPPEAAAWYRDVLGARIDVLAGTARRRAAARPELRAAEAIVSIHEFALLIYRTDQRLESTRGQRVDHVAFVCRDLDGMLARLRAQTVAVPASPAPFDDGRAAMIEGPDRMAIELIEASPTARDRD